VKFAILTLGIFAIVLFSISSAHAEPSVQIIMEKTTFSYGEKLFYTIQVSEVTGDLAIIHIRDETGKGSSAIPFEISQLTTEVPSLYPFEKMVFPEGKYFIDVQYSGAEHTAEFELIDSGNLVIPFQTKQIAYSWLTSQVSAGIFIDSINKLVEKQDISIPFVVNGDSIATIYIPEWFKVTTGWWLEERITDETFANAIQNLLDREIITG
jgi:hypothetical protein